MSLLVVEHRIVATYRPDGWPVGVITGYLDGDTFHVEHVIVFNGAAPTALMAMLREGIERAWAMGCRRIEWYVPYHSRLALGLAKVGYRLGFRLTHRDADMIHFAREL